MDKKAAYLAGHKACGLKVGDKVRVTREAKDYENGWAVKWHIDMNACIGKISEIIGDRGDAGYAVRTIVEKGGFSSTFSFPWFVLEPVEEEKLVGTVHFPDEASRELLVVAAKLILKACGKED